MDEEKSAIWSQNLFHHLSLFKENLNLSAIVFYYQLPPYSTNFLYKSIFRRDEHFANMSFVVTSAWTFSNYSTTICPDHHHLMT